MAKALGDVSFAEMLADLQKASRKQKQSVEGFTTRQASEATGKAILTVQRQIRDAFHVGAVVFSGKRMELGIDGVERPVPVYRMVKKSK